MNRQTPGRHTRLQHIAQSRPNPPALPILVHIQAIQIPLRPYIPKANQAPLIHSHIRPMLQQRSIPAPQIRQLRRPDPQLLRRIITGIHRMHRLIKQRAQRRQIRNSVRPYLHTQTHHLNNRANNARKQHTTAPRKNKQIAAPLQNNQKEEAQGPFLPPTEKNAHQLSALRSASSNPATHPPNCTAVKLRAHIREHKTAALPQRHQHTRTQLHAKHTYRIASITRIKHRRHTHPQTNAPTPFQKRSASPPSAGDT